MIYQFRTEAGSLVEIDMSPSDAPAGGETIERDGAKLTRVYGETQAMVSTFKPFKSMQLSHGWPYANKWEKLPNGKRGAPIFTNEAEARGCMAAGERNGEGTHWKAD